MNELIEKATETIVSRYEKGKHSVGAAVRTVSGNIYVGVCINSQKVDICSEWTAIGAAATAGDDEITMAVAVHQKSDGTHEIYPPCGLCRELYATWFPNAEIILPGEEIVKAESLLPKAWKKDV